MASPLAERRSSRLPSRNVQLNGWGGFESLQRFDDWYGQDNFDSGKNEKVVIEQDVLICRPLDVHVVQQKLAILQETAKRIVTEQICEVETQIIVLEQYKAGHEQFDRDIKRESGKPVGFDKNIADKFQQIYKPDGGLNDQVHDFNGQDVGKNVVVVGGNNWQDNDGQVRVQQAFDAAQQAKLFAQQQPQQFW